MSQVLYTTCDLVLDDRIPPTKLSEQYNREKVVIVCARISWYYTLSKLLDHVNWLRSTKAAVSRQIST